ncbi:MAG: T9SS type A sorting domain-containing protein [Sphingobacteriales bacterium]|jgi:hypothetical protein|nr:T9SS type A sorting domain-containing protein [Sphingobacteriales bacterium]MBP9140802.1 T9SS type A sorting domain-containing protein [Chitinophagales bacterium]MDA0198342.1 M43 family zinc metalloprotease [Bacteroidota bacterium]MBK6891216.1 T9SS type A sorting domain-containing protein [Sphingobacteriales bacterium]MBK7526959.1 T9SS type A sorting domain-containing protein [Sphingobacteriales bacterium]
MKKSYLLLLFALIGSVLPLMGQQNNNQNGVHRCGSFELELLQTILNKDYHKAVNATFEKAKAKAALNTAKDDKTYYVPVVVHVIHQTDEQKLSEEVIKSQIDVLNRDYSRQNADTALTRDVFKPVAANPNIQFYLTKIDPQGQPTNGITYTKTTVDNWSPLGDITKIFEVLDKCGIELADLLGGNLTEEQMACLEKELMGAGGFDKMKYNSNGGKDAWPTDKYLNIWVCNLGDLASGEGAILGFAYPPVGAPNWPDGQTGTPETDGVVIHYQVFGTNNPTLPTAYKEVVGEGRTTVHEVGHYLGLRHIWGDGDCTMDDGLTDTPEAAEATQQVCDYSKNTCDDGAADLPDMLENYMDYSDEDCMNMFTEQQAGIIRAMLEGPRVGLLDTLTLQAPKADFTSDKFGEILVGTTVNFSHLSSNATEFFWSFGPLGATSTLENPSYTYNEIGEYNVSFTASNSVGYDYITKDKYIKVVGEYTGITPPQQHPDKILTSVAPASGLHNAYTISVNGNIAQLQGKTYVFDALGRQVLSQNLQQKQQQVLMLNDLPKGIYYLVVALSQQSQTYKLIVN